MQTSNIILNAIGKDESILKKFTLSEFYLRLTFVISVLTLLFIFGIIFAFLYFFESFNNFYEKNSQDSFMYGVEKQDFDEEITGDFYYEEELIPQISFFVLWLLFFTVFLIIFPFLFFYHFYYLKISNEYVFTNQRILIKKGWIANRVTTIHYNRITDASVNQSILDRILGIGSLSISTAGSDGYKVILSHLGDPHTIKKELYEIKPNIKSAKKDDFDEM